jgi:hypothetical protein
MTAGSAVTFDVAGSGAETSEGNTLLMPAQRMLGNSGA